MAKVSVVLDKRRKTKSEEYPIKIRFYKDFKVWFLPLNLNSKVEHWNNKLNCYNSFVENLKQLNLLIKKSLLDAQNNILNLELNNSLYSIDDIKSIYQKKRPNKPVLPTNNFFNLADILVNQMKEAGRFGNAASYNAAVVIVRKYYKQEILKFEKIDYKFLSDLESHLYSNKYKTNSIGAFMRAIRAIINQAINHNIVDQKYYPFRKFKIKTEKTLNRTLTIEQLKAIKNLELTGQSARSRTRDYFILSFYLRGINFRDLALLTKDNLQDNRIIYKRAKTHKFYSIKIEPQIQSILDKYYSESSDYLLPIINPKYSSQDVHRIAKEAIKNCNARHLKYIAQSLKIPKITFYYARYTWANIAKQLGYSKDKIAEALGHEYGNKVTGIYLHSYGNEVIDEMNYKICQCFLHNSNKMQHLI